MKKIHYLLGLALLLVGMPVSAQVSNDNEDEVYKADAHQKKDFVPGQVIVKFKDDSGIQVQQNSQGKFRAASINAVNQVLRDFNVDEMDKLFPAQVAKPQNKLRRAIAPNGQIVKEKNLDKIFIINLQATPDDATLQLVKRLEELSDVEYAEPNYYAYITADTPAPNLNGDRTSTSQTTKAPASVETTASVICPTPGNNPLYVNQYGITQQNIHQLWNKPIINKKRPVIAILDTGVDINHPDLKDNIWTNTAEAEGETAFDDDNNGIVDDVHGWDFVENYYETPDRNGHGTHCAGIAAAADNTLGIVGANPLALIMPIKVMSDRGVGDIANISRGIIYAAENGADILSMSFGTGLLPKVMMDALDYAYQTAVLVAAAGNCGYDIYNPNGINYPAAYYLVLGVEASVQGGQRAIFSNYDPDGPIYCEYGVDGPNYEIQVPGADIYSTYLNGQYKSLNGTSMSTPLFAGAVSALMMVKDYPSKDVLFGDLIHLKADFAKIYSDETPRMPKIGLVAMNIDDNVAGNSNIDGQVDVGETVLISPVLRNTWADATDIRLKLSVDNLYQDFVTIVNPEVDFGHSLSAYGRATAETPIQVKFKDNIGDNTRIKFLLEVSYHESAESFTQNVYVTVNNTVKISGMITSDRTLTADHVYYVNENLSVREGATLTIEPGTRLEFAEGMGLASFGKLVANGTPEKPIVFTGHRGEGPWMGVASHEPSGKVEHGNVIYTNADYTKFTLERTDDTPIRVNHEIVKGVYYDAANEDSPQKTFWLSNYVEDEYLNYPDLDMTGKTELLTDPDFLTPAILRAMADWKAYYQQFPTEPTETKKDWASINLSLISWYTYDNPRDEISYCQIEGYSPNDCYYPILKDCILEPYENALGVFHNLRGDRVVITNTNGWNEIRWNYYQQQLKYSNIINNTFTRTVCLPKYSDLHNNNYFNNFCIYDGSGKYNGKTYSLAIDTSEEDVSKYPSYLGTGKESIIRPYIFEIGNAPETFGSINLDNMPTRPYAEAHGIVWKVLVDDKDAQDEFEGMSALGVGKHKFEVYFNRPMNTAVTPTVSFGVREPYNQHEIAEDGKWNADGTIYTANVTITGKTTSDGKNRIYVRGAEDNEFFPCPEEKTRFNFLIGAAGSLATGFAAEPGMGRVNLTWNNDENDFDDAMGFNIYRYTIDENEKADTMKVNKTIVDIETTEYTDYDVTPGTTYHYYYKVLSTDLQEYDVSNVVAATPLTATLGDANGSGDVDVSDVVTTVGYITGDEPKPFIFEAADMNKDQSIDVLDVIGIIQVILSNPAPAMASVESTAVYTVENGVLYVESPVALAGVQAQVNSLTPNPSPTGEGSIAVASDLDGFEHVTAWLTDNDMLFLAYNMNGKTLTPGKHALLKIGDADVTKIRLSDTQGHNVEVVAGEGATAIDAMGSKVQLQGGVFNLKGQKVSGKTNDLQKLPKGVYIINGEKVVK